MDKLITVIIPVYNVENYIEDSLNSVINQTYRNIEIILVDDGSTDNSYEICKRFFEKDSRIKLFHQENKGVSSARNLGLLNSTGDYITFIDSDDIIESNAYEEVLDSIKNSNADVGIFNYSNCFYNDNNEYIVEQVNQDFEGTLSREEALCNILSSNKYKGFVCNKVIKRDKIISEDNKLLVKFDENVKMMEDSLFCVNVIKNSEKIVFINKAFYNYLIRENSATKKSIIEEKIFVYKKILSIIKHSQNAEYIVKWHLYSDYLNIFFNEYSEKNFINVQILKEIIKLRNEFLKVKPLSILGLIKKILIEFGIRMKIDKNILKKIMSI